MKGKLIVVSGPSGVGKGTVRAKLFEVTNNRFEYSISATTRDPREGEVNGVDYFFISTEEFGEKVKNDEFIEWAEFVGNKYGTLKSYVTERLEAGKDVILEIEVEGALQVKKKFDDALCIFIMPPSMEELESRIRGRGTEAEEVIAERLEKARVEMELKDQYDYTVTNKDIEKTALEIIQIIDNVKESSNA